VVASGSIATACLTWSRCLLRPMLEHGGERGLGPLVRAHCRLSDGVVRPASGVAAIRGIRLALGHGCNCMPTLIAVPRAQAVCDSRSSRPPLSRGRGVMVSSVGHAGSTWPGSFVRRGTLLRRTTCWTHRPTCPIRQRRLRGQRVEYRGSVGSTPDVCSTSGATPPASGCGIADGPAWTFSPHLSAPFPRGHGAPSRSWDACGNADTSHTSRADDVTIRVDGAPAPVGGTIEVPESARDGCRAALSGLYPTARSRHDPVVDLATSENHLEFAQTAGCNLRARGARNAWEWPPWRPGMTFALPRVDCVYADSVSDPASLS